MCWRCTSTAHTFRCSVWFAWNNSEKMAHGAVDGHMHAVFRWMDLIRQTDWFKSNASWSISLCQSPFTSAEALKRKGVSCSNLRLIYRCLFGTDRKRHDQFHIVNYDGKLARCNWKRSAMIVAFNQNAPRWTTNVCKGSEVAKRDLLNMKLWLYSQRRIIHIYLHWAVYCYYILI